MLVSHIKGVKIFSTSDRNKFYKAKNLLKYASVGFETAENTKEAIQYLYPYNMSRKIEIFVDDTDVDKALKILKPLKKEYNYGEISKYTSLLGVFVFIAIILIILLVI